jgi:hypothetical protein
LDGDWANIDGLLLFNPAAPINIDDGGTALIAMGCGGRISKPLFELVGTRLT